MRWRSIGDVSEKWTALWRYRNDCLRHCQMAMTMPLGFWRSLAEHEAYMAGHESAYLQLSGAESERDFARYIGPGFGGDFGNWLQWKGHIQSSSVGWSTALQLDQGLERWEEDSPVFEMLRAFFDEWVPEPRRIPAAPPPVDS